MINLDARSIAFAAVLFPASVSDRLSSQQAGTTPQLTVREAESNHWRLLRTFIVRFIIQSVYSRAAGLRRLACDD
jgi:hypothetical protein